MKEGVDQLMEPCPTREHPILIGRDYCPHCRTRRKKPVPRTKPLVSGWVVTACFLFTGATGYLSLESPNLLSIAFFGTVCTAVLGLIHFLTGSP